VQLTTPNRAAAAPESSKKAFKNALGRETTNSPQVEAARQLGKRVGLLLGNLAADNELGRQTFRKHLPSLIDDIDRLAETLAHGVAA
jgi:hypothetical protein